jgi:hypothetical protein
VIMTSSRAWTLASTRRSWFSSHKSWCVNWFSKQSAIALAFSNGWNFRPEGQWIAVGAFGPSLFMRDFGMSHIAWGDHKVTYFCFPPLNCLFTGHSSDWFRDPIKLDSCKKKMTMIGGSLSRPPAPSQDTPLLWHQ